MSETPLEAPPSPVKAAPVRWPAKALRRWGGDALLRRMVAACLEQILPNAAALANGSDDPEHVHQLRVGLRRLRSAAHALAPFDAALPQDWQAAAMPVFDALGEARDRYVRATTLAPKLARAGAPAPDIEPATSSDLAPLRRLVRGHRFQDVLERLSACATARPEGADPQAGGGLDRLVSRLHRLAHQATRGARGFEALPFERQHHVRKRLKRLRYLADFAAPAFDRREFKAWTACVSRAQDALGRHVDLVTAARHFESLAGSDPRAWFAVGWLQAKTRRSARQARRALVALRKVEAFWCS